MRRRLNIGVFFITLLLAVTSCKSYKPLSGNPNYRPLKEFKGDTLAYLNYNFNIHKDFYIGKRFDVLLHDIEGEPNTIPSANYEKNKKEKFITFTYLDLDYNPLKQRNKRYEDGLLIYFEDSSRISYSDFLNYRKNLEESEPQILQIELFYKLRDYLSDCIISNIEVYRFDHEDGNTIETNKSRKYWDVLQSDVWKRYCDYDKLKEQQTIHFSKDTLFIYTKKGKRKETKKFPYYIEYNYKKDLTEKFNDEKVGGTNNGNCIVLKGENGRAMVFEIYYFYFMKKIIRFRSLETGELLDFKKKGNKKK